MWRGRRRHPVWGVFVSERIDLFVPGHKHDSSAYIASGKLQSDLTFSNFELDIEFKARVFHRSEMEALQLARLQPDWDLLLPVYTGDKQTH